MSGQKNPRHLALAQASLRVWLTRMSLDGLPVRISQIKFRRHQGINLTDFDFRIQEFPELRFHATYGDLTSRFTVRLSHPRRNTNPIHTPEELDQALGAYRAYIDLRRQQSGQPAPRPRRR